MKIIFSRKGLDSQYGRIPSPIFPDGSILSLPIPSRFGRPLRGISTGQGPLHRIVADLSGGVLGPEQLVHLDPDLDPRAVTRQLAWRPSLGQIGTAQQHLAKQGVGPGDLFLFFGWFRAAEFYRGRWRYVPGAPSIHSLFGWLQVGMVQPIARGFDAPAWLQDHPHVQHSRDMSSNNTLYIASDKLALPSAGSPGQGAGVFRRWSESLRLTAPDAATRSVWRLPAWVGPGSLGPLSYHTNPGRWTVEGDFVRLRTVGKGQEFVQDVGTDGDPVEWIYSLIQKHA